MDLKRTGHSGFGPSRRERPGAPASPAGPKREAPGLQGEIDQLGRNIQQLRIDFERFFSGDLPLPPEELRLRIQAQLRALRNASGATAVDSFRLTDMEARYNTYNELYNRRLREREEGRRKSGPHPRVREEQRFDVYRGVVAEGVLPPAAVEALYAGLAASQEGGPRFDLASFGAYLARQAAALREKTGCHAVQFRLAHEEGKLKLKARPVGVAKGPV